MKKGTLKTIAVVLAFLILGTAVTACITKGFKDWNPYGWFDKECEHEYGEDGICTKCGGKQSDEQDDKDSAEVISESYEVIGHGMKLNVMRSTVALNSDEGIATVAETATSYTVTATVLDVNSIANDIIQDVKWQMAWANSNSATVTDYVTMTVDGMKATFTLKAPFTTQIKVTCTSVFDSSKSATLTLDYAKRLSGGFGFTSNGDSYDVGDGGRVVDVDFYEDWTLGGSNTFSVESFKCTGFSFGTGSCENPIKSIAVTISASDSFLSYFDNLKSPYNMLHSKATSDTKTFDSASAFKLSQYDIYDAIWGSFLWGSAAPSNSCVYKSSIFAGLANTTNQFNLNVVVTPTYGDAKTYNVVLNVSVPISVSSVSLSKTGYIF